MRYICGEDVYEARRHIGDLAEKEKAEIRWVDRQDIDEDINVLQGQANSLLGRVMKVVRDPSSMPQAVQEKCLEGECVLWDRGKPDKRTKIWKKLKNETEEFAQQPEAHLITWLGDEAKEMGGEMKPEAAKFLIASVGMDKWRLKNEMERLLLLEKKIDLELVQSEMDSNPTVEIFATLDALTQGDRKRAVEAVENLLEMGNSELYILAMLNWQFKNLWMIRVGDTKSLNPYVVSKNRQTAMRFSENQLQGVMAKILATDMVIKQGRLDQRTALMMLVATI